MWKSKYSVVLSLTLCIGVALTLIVSLFMIPTIAEGYFGAWHGFGEEVVDMVTRTVLICYYPSAILGLVALAALIKMLLNIKAEKTFIAENVTALRVISWCCFIVSAICIWGMNRYVSLCFVAAAAGFVGVILRVVKNVMQSAVEIKSENDLTI